MDYKIVALDLDGTLVNSQHEISDKNSDILIKIQEMGCKVAIATGRPFKGATRQAEKLKLSKFGGYIMCYNGGLIMDCSDNRIIYSRELPHEYIPEICEGIKGMDITINTYTADEIIASNSRNKSTEIEPSIVGMNLHFVDDFVKFVDFPINKCLLTGEPETIAKLEKIYKEQFKGRLDVFKSEAFFLELVPIGVNKGEAITKLAEINNVDISETMSFGDGFNDVELIKTAGMGIAMANACPEVLNAADYVTLSNDMDGVAAGIEKFFFGK